MSTKMPSATLAAPPLGGGPAQAPPTVTDERLKRIEAMCQRINGYVQFMCRVGSLNGTSAEAKENAVAAFHDRMAALERQLSRIHENLQLG